ncbi:SLATT domain-containing protein [Cryobacterium sp. 10S3]|uniref:SLATT domain-containing protein n=1 Tax=unclassified Cryobacterium TaxID=2649013 RepID=UPI002AC8E423|nr:MULTISPECIES: SLATT domain-containing protein [unclassified Cryobacterium]MEB0286713.1 SLATT domain-containing protein [Cryobacterium sp. 10S3]WPX13166.1 SLATT domain-containing protein [Cryobacterium sp. 10S3]
MSELERVAARSYKSYRARLVASNRLQARQRAWNTCLLALSVATTVASIALLSDGTMYGNAGPTVLVCVSVGALISSLVAAGLNYGGRSRDMFMNYRALQRLSVEAESMLDREFVHDEEVSKLTERHNALLDDSENHTSADHKSADPEAPISIWVLRRAQWLTNLPYLALSVPVLVVWPFAHWALRGGK